MKKTFNLAIIFVFMIQMNVFSQNPREISEKALSVIEFESMEMTSTLKIFDNRGNVRERTVVIAIKKFGEITKTLIKFLSPADIRGTAMLIYDYEDKPDDMWIYLPSLRRTRRIISSERGKSFMGSEFSNADMSKPNLNDFTFKLLGTEKVNGKECWKIESACKDENLAGEYGFTRKMAYIEKDNFLTWKTEYYDFNGGLYKTLIMSDYRKQGNGKYFSFGMEIMNIQNSRKSVMEVDKFQLGSGMSEDSFSTAALER